MNKLYIDQKLVIRIEPYTFKKARIRYKLILEDGTEIILHKEKKIWCYVTCSKCGRLIKRRFKKKLFEQNNICGSCSIMGENNPFYGKHHTDKAKEMISRANKGRNVGEKSPMYGRKNQDFMTEEQIALWKKRLSIANSGERNGFYGKRHTEELKKWWSESKKGKFAGDKNPMYGKKLSDVMSPEKYKQWLDHFSKTLEKHSTYPEKVVEEWLIKNNIEYKHSFFLYNEQSKKSHQYDFFIESKKCLIEVQGDYWHGNPRFFNESGDQGHKKLDKIQHKRIDTDKVKFELAKKLGYDIIYIWEYDIINGNFEALGQLL